MWGIRVAVIDKGRQEKKQITARHKCEALHPLRTSFERYGEVFTALGFKFTPDFGSLFGTEKGDEGLYSHLTPPKQPGEYWVGIAPFAKHEGKIYPLDRMEMWWPSWLPNRM